MCRLLGTSNSCRSYIKHKNSNCLKRSLDKVSKKRNSFEHSYSSNGENSEIQFKMYGQVPCVGIVGGIIGAVRSRIITSTGMKDVKGNDNEITLHKEWDILHWFSEHVDVCNAHHCFEPGFGS